MKSRLTIVLLFVFQSVFSQSVIRTDVKSKWQNSGVIFQHGVVKGYYSFFELERTDKENTNYQLSVFDENLQLVNSSNTIRSKSYELIESSYNGACFVFLFFDRVKKELELISFDNSLTALGSSIVSIKGEGGFNVYQNIVDGYPAEQRYLVPISDKGFIHYSMAGSDKENYTVEYYSNALDRKWSYVSTAKKYSSPLESASEAFQTDQAIGSLVFKTKKASSHRYEYSLMAQEPTAGNVLFNTSFSAKDISITPGQVTYDSSKKEVLVFGEYYKGRSKQLNNGSLGFCYASYNASGNQTFLKTLSWEEISKKAPVDDKGRFTGNDTDILFHDFIRTPDGQMFAIGEQYRIVLSAIGLGSKLLAGVVIGFYHQPISMVQMNTYNLVVFQFNADYTLNKVHVFEKNKSQILLPTGAADIPPRLLTYFLKSSGSFDYQFSQKLLDNESFVITYVDADKDHKIDYVNDVKNHKSTIGFITYTPEKKFTTDKIVVDRKSELFSLEMAKPGYILIKEYFKKEKKFSMRLEKINY